ncbi:MAG: polysaccharide biosynthesis C-terminal domain-containing protein [Bacteroidetes bacterium]|nr:polysaccharide biosynthesis C-terminal domain-containing protein [Bacteroidota bacterium]
MRSFKFINNVSSLQIFQLTRFSTFLVISILFTKSYLSPEEIGIFEVFLFIASFISFFWVTGLIQSFLPLFKNNKAFSRDGENNTTKSPEIFNAFILLAFFSFVAFLFGLSIKHNFSVFGISGDVPVINLLLVYILLSNPSVLIEYIYLLNNKPANILLYGTITFSLQLGFVVIPVFLEYEIVYAIWGLIAVSILRLIWLFFLLVKYSEFRISFPFIKEHLMLGAPLIISALLSGSAQYIDGAIVTSKFDAGTFAIFRYGAKEFPLVILLANGLSNAMLSEFSTPDKIKSSMKILKRKSARLMHFLFPVTVVVMYFTRWLYPIIFNENFTRSADIFLIYLLLIISRLVFPQTILIGMKKTGVVLRASLVEIILNVALSLYLVQFYGLVGIALATAIVYVIEKVYLIGYLYSKLKIKPAEYIPINYHLIYSGILIIMFVLIDHRIISF